jgi:Holliday junction resolvasome RuvABC DNA-binding subunit
MDSAAHGARSTGNSRYVDRLREAADLLEAQGANPFRVSAYRRAADTLGGLGEDVDELLEREGLSGLDALPGIGRGIAAAIAEIHRSGHWMQLERLRGSADPVQLFTVIPGLGHRLAERIHEELHIDTLEALEIAAHDGRLESVPGVGARRAASIRSSLQSMLARTRPRAVAIAADATTARAAPATSLLLAIDQEYRERAATGQLPTIAPKRFNPSGENWLPVMHAERDGWHFTALFSNTAQAHQLGRTHDWVVLYFYDSDHSEGQSTVVTETHGPLAGRRVVRGREAECRRHYGLGG